MQELVEDFLQYLRNERGQSENTQRTYAALLGKFVIWAEKQSLKTWTAINLSHLIAFLQHEQKRRPLSHPMGEGQGEGTRLSSESLYLQIAALRAFYKFAENEKLLPHNIAENFSLPRRWQRLPKALTDDEIEKLLKPEIPETPSS